MVFKWAVGKLRRLLSNHPDLISKIDQRPHWARVLEALHYEQYIDEQTAYDEIDESNTHPLGLSVEQYKDAIKFLNRHGLIEFPPEDGATCGGLTKDGFKWIKGRQRTLAQAQQNRATSKLTLALLIVSAVSFFDLSEANIVGITGLLGLTVLLGYIGLTVVYDIIIREY